MTENEQIQEMVELAYPFVDGTACEQESGSCEFITCRDCNALNTAKTLYSKGYRKVERSEWRSETDEEEPNPMFKLVVCRVCEKTANERYDFCPHCGADMRGEKDGSTRSN